MPKARIIDVVNKDEDADFGAFANHILAEGDSWFAWSHLNARPSSNLLKELDFEQKTVIFNYAFSGDVIRNMGDIATNPQFYFGMQWARFDAILISGGGNDLIDALDARPGQSGIVAARPPGTPDVAESYIDHAALQALLDDVLTGYRQLIGHRDQSTCAGVPLFLHTYDYPTPRPAKSTFMGVGAKGPWLIAALRKAGAPAQLHRTVTELIYDAMGLALLSLNDPANGVHVVETRNTLARALPDTTAVSGDWINEIHPTSQGFALLAAKLNLALRDAGIR